MENYNQIVENWYVKLQNDFIDTLMCRYYKSKMRREDAQNIYQDVFLVINENLKQGKIKENTSWRSYIMRVGFNLASKCYRGAEFIDSIEENRITFNTINSDFDELMPEHECAYEIDDAPSYTSSEIIDILHEELEKIPVNHRDVLVMHYGEGMKDSCIAEEISDYRSASSVKVVRNRVMKQFKEKMHLRVKELSLSA